MSPGEQPSTGATKTAVIVSILQRQPPKPGNEFANYQPALSEIFQNTLNKDRDQRYQTAGELLTDLKNLKQRSETQSHKKRLTKSSFAQQAPTSRLIKFI